MAHRIEYAQRIIKKPNPPKDGGTTSQGYPHRATSRGSYGIGRLPVKDIKSSADAPARDDNDESQNDAQIADEVVKDKSIIQLEPDSPNEGETPGYNPYDSGTFDTSKSWDSHAKFKRTF